MSDQIKNQQTKAEKRFRELRNQMVGSIQKLDGSEFIEKEWQRPGGGGGLMSLLKGKIFEKVGVNFSKDYGKLSIIAKGVRKVKNLNGAILQPLNHINLVYYFKAKRNIQTYKEASIIKKYDDISRNYNKILISSVILDMINYSSIEDNPCDIIFRLTNKTLDKINSSESKNIFYYFISI